MTSQFFLRGRARPVPGRRGDRDAISECKTVRVPVSLPFTPASRFHSPLPLLETRPAAGLRSAVRLALISFDSELPRYPKGIRRRQTAGIQCRRIRLRYTYWP